jgi:amino acid transporter
LRVRSPGGASSARLGYWLVVGATISSLGTFNAQVASGSRVIWRLSKYGMLPKVFGFEWGPRRVPVVAIAVLCGAAVAMSSVSFDQLVEADNFVFSFVMLQAMAAFVYLKYKHPATVRPFEVPGGVYGSVLICLPPAALIVFVFSIAQWSTWVIAGATNLVCLIAYVLWQRRSINWLCSQQDATHKHDDDV